MPYIARYELRITVDRPIDLTELDPAFTAAEHFAWYVEQKTKSELEREVIHALRKLDGDVTDCEVMTAEVKADAQDCAGCDGYVLNASEAPYCPTCARERR